MSETKSELKEKLKSKIQKLKEKANLMEGLNKSVSKHSMLIESLKKENSMSAELFEKVFKENAMLLTEQEKMKTDLNDIGSVLDKILGLITEYQAAEKGEEIAPETEEAVKTEDAVIEVKVEETPEGIAVTEVPEVESEEVESEKKEDEEVKEAVSSEEATLESVMNKLSDSEKALLQNALKPEEKKPLPPVQMESGLKADISVTLIEKVNKNKESSLSKLF